MDHLAGVVSELRAVSVPNRFTSRIWITEFGYGGYEDATIAACTAEAQRDLVQRTLTAVNKDPAPIIPTTPSALQNITDVANRIVERMDQVLSDRNVASINATLANLETISGGLADRDQGTQALLLSARDAARSLDVTLKSTNGTIQRLDTNLVQQLPPILDKLESTLSKLDSASGNADKILGENRAAINSFANDGLGQLGPTLTELRGLIRDLRRVSDRLDNNPARYLLGRDAPKEFQPK
jgi:phospholipid/cholesterol/gamma-HCH transport system substrate-binding protein